MTLRTHIFVFLVLFNVFHLFSCVERSDWIYDRETNTMNTTIANGTTYSCRLVDFATPSADKMLASQNQVCLDGTQTENDTSCVRLDAFRILNEMMKATDKSPGCVVYPVPTAEEVFEKIEKIYRSLTDDDQLVPNEWFLEFAENVTRMRTEYANSTNAVEEIELARQNAAAILIYHRAELPEMRKRVSRLQQELLEAKLTEESNRRMIPVDDGVKSDDYLKDLVFTEITALKDSYEFELYDWKLLAQQRANFVELVSARKRIEHAQTVLTQKVEEARMSVLSVMAATNALVATIEATIREVEYHSELARQYATDTFMEV